MRNWTEHGFSRLTAISDAGSTPAASTSLRPSGYGSACQRQFFIIAMQFWSYAKAVAPERKRRRTSPFGLRLGMPAADFS
jgi:hypothetical protein